jgi:hypothetical protein
MHVSSTLPYAAETLVTYPSFAGYFLIEDEEDKLGTSFEHLKG